MRDFNTYFRMEEADVLEFVKLNLTFFAQEAELICKEIGDGNLNYVFRVVDSNEGRSLVIKQAGTVARISDEFKVSLDRNRIESEVLSLQSKLAPGFVAKVHYHDKTMKFFVMEDLSDYEIMRTGLLKYKKYPLFVDHITTFLVNTLLLTSDIVMCHKKKKELVKQFINPDLCQITEDLVFTEPFIDHPRNDVFNGTREFVNDVIWGDQELALEIAKLKFEFMTNAQCLLHGDLHTGSILIKEDSMKVIDPEFAFFGPLGYDLGIIIANLIFAYVHAKVTLEDKDKRLDYMTYLEDTIRDTVDLFKYKFLKAWDEEVTESVAKNKEFKEYYLNEILKDTAASAGLELCRRIIGIAHVKDITSIEEPAKREVADKICLSSGKMFILEREWVKTGEDYVKVISEFERLFDE